MGALLENPLFVLWLTLIIDLADPGTFSEIFNSVFHSTINLPFETVWLYWQRRNWKLCHGRSGGQWRGYSLCYGQYIMGLLPVFRTHCSTLYIEGQNGQHLSPHIQRGRCSMEIFQVCNLSCSWHCFHEFTISRIYKSYVSQFWLMDWCKWIKTDLGTIFTLRKGVLRLFRTKPMSLCNCSLDYCVLRSVTLYSSKSR